MLRTPFVLAVASALFWAAPAQATNFGFSDARILINFVVVEEDPQSDTTPSSEVMNDLGSIGWATASGGFVLGSGMPPTHVLEARIDLTGATTDTITARSFTEYIQQFDIVDLDPLSTGLTDLQITFEVDWSMEFAPDVSGNTFKDLSFIQFDSVGSFQQSFGLLSASSTDGGAPVLSGSGIDFSALNVFQVGGLWQIQGDAVLDITSGSVNSTDNFFGLQFSSEITMNGGGPGDFAESGHGNFVSWTMASTETSVSVSAIPEPSAAALLALGLVGLALRRRGAS